ncbi:MAG: aldehyde dehydrogenase family protein [Planctomycetota bacterium]|nr:aldehyde dehydrogenase family protein [Planctomycetota bacterium]
MATSTGPGTNMGTNTGTSMGTGTDTGSATGSANGSAGGPGAVVPGAIERARSTAAPAGWDYAPAPESLKVAIAPEYGHFINGRFVAPRARSSKGEWFATINPATEQALSRVAQGSEADVDAAVKAARAALPAWSSCPPLERGKLLFRLARRIQERSRELAVLETMDSGKPIKESRDVDLPLVAAHFFYYAGWADKLEYAFPGYFDAREPARRVPPAIGVCAQVIPWNFPLLMAAWKLAPALACGNTCVLKPAETTPLTALRLAEIIQELDFPPGVVNIVTGDGATGAALVSHPGVDKIAFTGSTDVGKKIAMRVAERVEEGDEGVDEQRRSSRRGAPGLTLELGGKSPHIIFADAAIDQAIEGIISGIYFNQGEVCCAGSRLLVEESVLPQVVAKLEHRLARLRVGDPMDKNTDVGAINSRAQLDRVEHYLELGQREGAKLTCPSGSPTGGFARGYFCRPCFFTDVQPSHAIARDEIFGPVLAVMSFRTPEEAILRANNTPYGLAAGVWTDKGSKMLDVARKLKAGVVWCNTYNKFDPSSPFGGYRESGFGREGGVHGLAGYVHH